jgi:hypothetical protein
MQFYYYDDSERKGPVASVRLREMARNGEIRPETIVETASGTQSKASEISSLATGLSLEEEFASIVSADPEPLDLDAPSIDLTSSPALELEADSNALDLGPASELTIETAFEPKPFEYVPYQVETLETPEPQGPTSAPEPLPEDPLHSLNEELLQETPTSEIKLENDAAPPLDAPSAEPEPVGRAPSNVQPSKAELQPSEAEPVSGPRKFLKKNKHGYSLESLLTTSAIAALSIVFVARRHMAFGALSLIAAFVFLLASTPTFEASNAPSKKGPASGKEVSGCWFFALVLLTPLFLIGPEPHMLLSFPAIAIIVFCLYRAINVFKP